MIGTLGRYAAPIFAVTAVWFVATPAFAQQPTDAQRDAIRSSCRSDYEANCASVPPGGMASLQCLQKNMSKLSSSCQQAVSAVESPAAAPKAESAPATPTPATPAPANAAAPATPKASASPLTKKPTDAQVAAVRTSCRSDYPKVCGSVPPGGEAALNCLEKNKSKVSAACQKAVGAIAGSTAAPAAASASAAVPAAAPAPAPALVLRPMLPREELFVLRSACGADVRTLCGGVAPGGGRIVQCLAVRSSSLSPACADVLSQFSAR